jgi:hypothetical protein
MLKNNIVFLSAILLSQACTKPNSSKETVDSQRSITAVNNQERSVASISTPDLQSDNLVNNVPWYQLKKGAGISNRSAEISNQDGHFSMSVNLIIQTAKNVSATTRTRAAANLKNSNDLAKNALKAADATDSIIEIAVNILNNDIQKNSFEQLILQAAGFRQKINEVTSSSDLTSASELQEIFQRLLTSSNRVYDVITATFAYRQQAIHKLSILQANWYYTWGLNPLKMQSQSEIFVPMIWKADNHGRSTIEELNTILAARQGKKFNHILLYNEPNHEDQANTLAADGAAYINQNSDILKTFSKTYASPVAAGAGDLVTGNIQWLTDFFGFLNENIRPNSPDSLISVLAYHTYPDPVAMGLIPTYAKPNNPRDPFYKTNDISGGRLLIDNTENIERVARKLAKSFIQRLHYTYRAYKLPIWITEFGIADWQATNCRDRKTGILDPACTPVKNRISPLIVKRFLEIVLPELYSRSYITRFAYFSNADTYNEQLTASAIFKEIKNNTTGFVSTSELTELVGNFYANYKYNSTCVRTEYLNSDNNFVEQQTVGCPSHTRDYVGWNFNENNQRWERTLTREEAGDFSLINKSCKTFRWRKTANIENNLIIEAKSPDCFPDSVQNQSTFIDSHGLSWNRTYTNLYTRVIDPSKEKISSLLMYEPYDPSDLNTED